jgi:hypothetical protein
MISGPDPWDSEEDMCARVQQCDNEQPNLPEPHSAGDFLKPRRQQAPCVPHQLHSPCFEHAFQQTWLLCMSGLRPARV